MVNEGTRTVGKALGVLYPPSSPKAYSTWEQVAGYFDGDGSVTFFLWKFVVAFYLDFADQYRDQLEQIASFLRSQGIPIGVTHKVSKAQAYTLRIADQDGVVKVAEGIAPYCFKKKQELITLLEYRKLDLISGSEVQKRFRRYVEIGKRERHGNRPFRPMPWSFSVGFRISRRNSALFKRKPRQVLSEAQMREVRERHNVFGQSIDVLSLSYGVSRSAIWRLLKK